MGGLPRFSDCGPPITYFLCVFEKFKNFEKIKVLKNSKIVTNSKNLEIFKKSEFFFERSEKIDIFNDITSVMFNAYLISTLKFQFEKNAKFNYVTSAILNAFSISTLKFEKIKYF